MDEIALQLANQTINDYQKNRQYLFGSLASTVSDITQAYHKKQTDFQQNFVATTNDLVVKIQDIHNKSIIRNKDTSCDFNTLSLFQIDEKSIVFY